LGERIALDILEFFGVAMSVALSAGVFVLIASFAKRIRSRSQVDSNAED
jgi:hypothetical protein